MTLDAQARRQARLDLDHNLVVEAGAGTGKTSLLIDRFLSLLVAGGGRREGCPLDHIVALTFTEKAAGEMRDRLAARLSEAMGYFSGTSLSGNRQSLWEAWQAEMTETFGLSADTLFERVRAAHGMLDRAVIDTLHAYAGRLLRLYPLEAGLDPGFEVESGPRYERLFEEVWSAWAARELGDSPPQAPLWRRVLKEVPLSDVKEAARALTWARSKALPADATPRLDLLRRRLRQIPEGKPPVKGHSKIHETLAALEAHLGALGAARLPGAPWPEATPDMGRYVQRKWPKAWADDPAEDIYEEALSLAKDCTPRGEAVTRAVAALVEPLVGEVRRLAERRGWVTFDGLLTHARDLLKHHPALRRALQERQSVFLVDEFQDTDPLQGEILFYLAETPGGGATDWRQVKVTPGTLFVVGDPKQSIYRFRGADMRAFQDFTGALLEQGGVRLHLSTSFRSPPELVEPANAVFSQLIQEEQGLQPPFHSLEPGASPKQGGWSWVVADPGLKGDAAHALEARWVAEWVLSQVGRSRAEGGALRLKDIALLFRAAAHLDPYLEAFKAAGLPYVVESDRSFFGHPEILDAANLLRVVDDASDHAAWVGWLRSPAVALSDADLVYLKDRGLLWAEEVPEGVTLPSGGENRWAAMVQAVAHWRARAQELSLGEWVAELWHTSPLVEAASQAYHGDQTVANLMKILRLAQEADETLSPAEFADQLRRSAEEGWEEGESPLADDQVDALRLMTIHKAKGLEFPVVFLAHCSSQLHRGRHRRVWREDWSTGLRGLILPESGLREAERVFLDRDEKVREEREALRLLYVAATRAKERLFLVGQPPKTAASFARHLAQAGFWPSSEGWEAWAPPVKGGVSLHYLKAGRAFPPRVSAPGEPLKRDEDRLEQTWLSRRAQGGQGVGRGLFISPSHLIPSSLLGISSGRPSANATLLGQVIHRVLEGGLTLDRETWPERVAQVVAGWGKPLPPGLPEEAGQMIWDFMQSPAGRRLAKVAVRGCELPLLFAKGGQVVRGTLDLLYRDEAGWWAADYKTNSVTLDECVSRAEAYRAQGSAYQEAVRRAWGEPCGFEVVWVRLGCSVRWRGDGEGAPELIDTFHPTI